MEKLINQMRVNVRVTVTITALVAATKNCHSRFNETDILAALTDSNGKSEQNIAMSIYIGSIFQKYLQKLLENSI